MSANPDVGLRLELGSDPRAFLHAARDYLAAEPVVSTVVATSADRAISQQVAGLEQPARNWWLVVRDERETVVGVGMRTAPFAPYPLFLLPMPDEAAVALAQVLHRRGEDVVAVNGALPPAQLCAAELARLGGGEVTVAEHIRLHELHELVQPKPTHGRLVPATESDIELVMQWLSAFMGDADEQAGRPRGASAHEVPERAAIVRRLKSGELSFWVDDAGRPVHLTALSAPAFGVVRVGPVYTPPDQRGRGWAANAVAEVSRRAQEAGARVCLFTDRANPTSNKLYAALGYRPVVDMANLLITRSDGPAASADHPKEHPSPDSDIAGTARQTEGSAR